MLMKSRWQAMIFTAVIFLAMAWGSAWAENVPLVDGEHWTKSTEQLKRAYLVGLANVIEVETAYSAAKRPSDDQSVIPRFARGMKGQTLDSVREALDKWYVAHPDKLKRPVIETIWFEMVLPGLAKNP